MFVGVFGVSSMDFITLNLYVDVSTYVFNINISSLMKKTMKKHHNLKMKNKIQNKIRNENKNENEFENEIRNEK